MSEKQISEIERALSSTSHFEVTGHGEQVIKFPSNSERKELEGFRKEVFDYFDVVEKRAS